MKKQLLRGQSLHKRATLAKRVSLYRIALGCRAAPGLGCGSRAKPILLELERNPAVAEAWLNRSGTLLAVVGKSTYPRSAQSLLDRHGLAGKALRREERARALEGFLSGAGWYRGAEVDRLSEEEAWVIAKRLVSRTAARAALDDARAEMLRQVIAQTCVRVLVGQGNETENGQLQAPGQEDDARPERVSARPKIPGSRGPRGKEEVIRSREHDAGSLRL